MGLFEFIYYLGLRLDALRKRILRKALPVKVISIGNITTGGTGKTPCTVALATEARRRGLRPCILTRGYKAGVRDAVIIKEGMRAADVGDEPLLMAGRLRFEIPVVAGRNRYRSGLFALDKLAPPPDLFILDDGFQHRELMRDIDVLLINSTDPFDNERLLPMGLLREPLSAITRADAVVLTKSEGVDTSVLQREVLHRSPDVPIYRASHAVTGIRTASGETMAPDALSGKTAYAFSGIGDPDSFMATLKSVGVEVAGHAQYADHHAYTEADIRHIAAEAARLNASWTITTEKDIMRLPGGKLPGNMELSSNLCWVLMDFVVDAGFYDLLLGGPDDQAHRHQ